MPYTVLRLRLGKAQFADRVLQLLAVDREEFLLLREGFIRVREIAREL
jgi:hypothetical protein